MPAWACSSASTSAPPASTWPCCGPDLTVLAQHDEDADVRDGPAVVLARVRT
jgi:hypothetical protein